MNTEDNNNILIVSEEEIVSEMEMKKMESKKKVENKKVDDRDDFLGESWEQVITKGGWIRFKVRIAINPIQSSNSD